MKIKKPKTIKKAELVGKIRKPLPASTKVHKSKMDKSRQVVKKELIQITEEETKG